jgi:multidrug efflux pump
MFISGITGAFFRQFAVTIAASTVISAFNSLTLSPALAAILLKPTTAKKDPVARALHFLFGWFFRAFNRGLRRATSVYTKIVARSLRASAIVLLLYGGLLFLTQYWLKQLPSGYIPTQDKGYLFIAVQLPDASSVERTARVMHQIDEIVRHTPGVAHRLVLTGQSFTLGAIAPNLGNFFVILDEFHKRTDPKLYYKAIVERLTKEIAAKVPDGVAFIAGPAPVQGLGSTGGWKVMIEDRADQGLPALQRNIDRVVAAARGTPPPAPAVKPADNTKPQATAKPVNAATPAKTAPPPGNSILTGVFAIFTVQYPQLFVDVNRDQCHAIGLTLGDVYDTLQVYLGSRYVNDFNLFGRTWQVIVQAEPQFRNRVSDVGRLRVRTPNGQTVPLGTLATVKEIAGPLVVTRYNLYPASFIQGDTQPGVSSGQAIQEMERVANTTLPKNMAFEWTEITYLQVLAANTGMILFGLAVLLVFLVLAAQYESWSLPLAVILVVPMCLLSATAGVAFAHSDVNVFTQIGFVVLVGLASKNAVLIVEFAKHKYESGMSRHEATLEACRLRLRPILMTSFAFILGVVPLVFATGAGAEMRKTLGNAVFSGMLGVTFFGIFLTPVFFNVIEWLGSSHVFATRAVERINRFVLGAISLGPVRRWVRAKAKSRSSKPGVGAKVASLPSGTPDSPRPVTAESATIIHVSANVPLIVTEPTDGGQRALKRETAPAQATNGHRATSPTNGDSTPNNDPRRASADDGASQNQSGRGAARKGSGKTTHADGSPTQAAPPPEEPGSDKV